MPNPKNPHSYPIEFQDLAELAPYMQEPFKVELTNPKEAKLLQGRWYSYIRSLERAVFSKRGQEEDPKRIAGGRSLSVSVEDSTVTFTPRHMTKEAQLFAAALDSFKAKEGTLFMPPSGFSFPQAEETPDYGLHNITSNAIPSNDERDS